MVKKILMIAFLIVPLLAACSSKDGKDAQVTPNGSSATATPKETPKAPIELVYYLNSMTPAEFEIYYVTALKEKFPYITFKGVAPGTGTNMENLIAAGTIPDVFIGTKGSIQNQMNALDLVEDITPLLKTNNYDLNRLEPAVVDIMQKASYGKIIGLPLNINANALYYNKDLFDKFSVSYPKDGMTWDDIYEIAKKLNRNDSGVQYRGMSDRWQNFFAYNPFELPYLDPKEEKSTFLNENWKIIANNWLRFYTLPGLTFDQNSAQTPADWGIFQTGISAMTVTARNMNTWNFNWDIVSVPTFTQKPGVGIQAEARYNFFIQTSKHKQAVFEVSAYMTSDEYQTKISKEGLFPVLKDENVKKVYMENNTLYKGKNIKALYYNKYAPEPQGRAVGLVTTINAQDKYLVPEMINVLLGKKDLNTALRNAHEALTQALVDAKKK